MEIPDSLTSFAFFLISEGHWLGGIGLSLKSIRYWYGTSLKLADFSILEHRMHLFYRFNYSGLALYTDIRLSTVFGILIRECVYSSLGTFLRVRSSSNLRFPQNKNQHLAFLSTLK